MFPLKDELPTARFPIVTATIIALNILVYLAGFGHAQVTSGQQVRVSNHDVWVYEYGVIPCEVFLRCDNQPGRVALEQPDLFSGQTETAELVVDEQPPLLTLLTSMFLHGGLLHLAFNMLFFWVYGNNVEDSMGRVTFLVYYLVGGLVAALAQGIISSGSSVPLIGASGAIAATIGGYLLLYPRTRILTIVTLIVIPIPMWLPAWLVAGVWGVGQFLATWQSVFIPTAAEGGVAYMAHLAGFVFGVLAIRSLANPNPIYDQMYRGGLARFGP